MSKVVGYCRCLRWWTGANGYSKMQSGEDEVVEVSSAKH